MKLRISDSNKFWLGWAIGLLSAWAGIILANRF